MVWLLMEFEGILDEGCSLVLKSLPSMCETPCSNPSTTRGEMSRILR